MSIQTSSSPSPHTPPVRERFHIATALRRTYEQGYDGAAFRADILAGMVVGVVALPLSMALAIAVGVPPQHGLYTAIIGGAVVALCGGSKFQVTGPTAAFVVILAPIVTRHGLPGLLTAGLMAGVLLVAMGATGFGRLIQYIPHPVTTGFTAGIATVIATLQLKDVFGLAITHMPDTYVGKILALWHARGSASLADAVAAAATLGLLLGLPRVLPGLVRRVPAPLIAIASVAVVVTLVHRHFPGFSVATIGSRFHATVGGHVVAGIPPVPPQPLLPWTGMAMSLGSLRSLLPAAFAIAMLGAIESLLSAVVADGMTGKRHDPDAELIALGIGNMVVPFFGGIAATGALARTATNIRAGARSPVAAVVHAAVVLIAILLLAPLVAYVPMASLAALLLLVAWNMSELHQVAHTLRVAPKSDIAVLVTCYGLTVAFDMVIAVSVGVVLAALLFMRRMSELTHTHVLDEPSEDATWTVPPGVVVYEVSGALFFGAAQEAMRAITTVGSDVRVVVLALGEVAMIDASGLVALENALGNLRHAHKQIVIAGPLPHPHKIFDKANLTAHYDHLTFADTLDAAIAVASDLVERERPAAARGSKPPTSAVFQ